MKVLVTVFTIFTAITSSAATDAQIAGAVFGDQRFIAAMGVSKLDDIEITEKSRGRYSIIVNSRAPMADGCSYSASVSEISERFAINPTTSGISNILKLTGIKTNCPSRGF